MYRLLNFSRTQWCKNSGRSFSSINSNSGCSVTEKTCHLCKQLINVTKLQKRLQSTKTNPQSAMKPKKPRPRKAKNYAEIVMVTDTASTEGKARVRKLSSTDVKLLADTNLNLSEVYKLKQITTDQNSFKEHTYNNLAIFDNLPSVAPSSSPVVRKRRSRKSDIVSYKMNQLPLIDSNICDSELISSEEHDIDIHNLPLPRTVNTFQPEEVPEEPQDQEATELELEPKEAPNNRLKMKLDAKHRQEIASKSLAAYNEVCSALKTPHRGLNAMYFHRNRTRRSPNYLPIKNVNVYNALLKGFASRGSYDKVQEILGLLRDEQISLNLQSYIAIFECLGRINIQDNHLKDIRIFVKAAVSQGFTFNQMLNSGSFLNNDRDFVIAAMKSYNPDFVPEYKHPQVQYKNHLLNHLNSDKQKNANSKRERNSTKGILSADKLSKLIDEQIASEKSGYVTVKSIENKGTPSEEVLTYRATLDQHYKMWEESAQAGFVRDLATLTAQRSSFSYEPYIRSIPIKDFIAIIIDEAKYLTQGSETYSPTVNMLYRDLGNKVYARYKVLRKQKTGVLDKICSIHNNYCKSYASDHDELGVLPAKKSFINPRQKWQWNEYRLVSEGATLSMDHQEWTPAVLQHIGKFLYHIVMHDLKIDVNSLRNSKHKNYLPAFYTIFRTQGRLVKEEVKPHPILSKLYRASVPETLTFPTYELPMRCPPIPWISIQTGGYLVSPCDVVRLPFQASTQKQRLSEGQVEQLFPSFDALNQLAAVPWKVNKSILDVILKVFTDGGSSKLDVPEPPTALPRPPAPSPEMDKGEKYQLFRQRLQYRRKKAEMYSLWCDCLYRLSLANHFRDDTFWLPHNMDFRGRVYPVPPHLNHLGSDLARSMLVFAEARPLGPEGLNWLKIHLINLTGLKKRDPISERLKYANEIMETILDSADKPLTGKMWWSKSDEPWQTLACCMEIAAASRSEKPEEFRSHFPIHQDGSCNGLQHYAALGRDSAGAHSVNLTPSEIPQDVYSAVVALVEQRRAQDAENGMEIAKTLEGFVKRKVIKQTIMTTVYGVTRFGARLQIARQLKDLDDFPKDSVWSASSYLTGRTFESLATMFTSTREIQDWFTDCARLISSVGGQQVEWVTPLGLPIVQPYFRFKKLSGVTVYDTFSIDKFEKPNVMKQKNAFPPNFIHSLDSCHMMLTSLHCERAGITFVSVHDCYWTHPSTVKIMNKICRDQFVALHSEPILEDLSMFLSNKYSYSAQDFSDDGSVIELTKKKLNRILRQLPKTGNFDIKQVLQSIYFFS